ncbi:MAG: transporter substrate-binding domain-containing protein, partial [Desulfobacterales bacterium]|nr:transporter substrate-binding domain-containing protein [Desulfobacterales bacterium]
DLPDLIARRYIRVLTTINRTNFFLQDTLAHGFEYSLLKDYEKYLNNSLKDRKLKVVIEFIPVTRDQLIPGLLEGRGDIAAAGLTITPKRKNLVDFTRPYLSGIEELIVSHKSVDDISSVDSLSGHEVFVRESSSYFESLVDLNQELEDKGLSHVDIVKADEALETEDILEMVNTGALDITVADSHLAEIWSKVFPDIRVHEDIVLRSGGRIAWMVRKDNPKLKESLNAFIKTREQGTLLGNIYFNRYYKNTKWLQNPLATQTPELDKHFRKYGEQYGFDWLLLKALAFQESGLDHKKKSPVGALGLMQIRPSTAMDDNVGISNYKTPEGNIHAGTRYLAFLRDHYYSNPGISERNRVRLALAAYNAGPAKVRKARKLAERMNLNPSSWFRNVEVAMLRLVGYETVKYVSNINKYYILFHNARKIEARRD